jgi:hypothetical protein
VLPVSSAHPGGKIRREAPWEAAAWVNAHDDWARLEVVGDSMRDRTLQIIAAFPWVQVATRVE